MYLLADDPPRHSEMPIAICHVVRNQSSCFYLASDHGEARQRVSFADERRARPLIFMAESKSQIRKAFNVHVFEAFRSQRWRVILGEWRTKSRRCAPGRVDLKPSRRWCADFTRKFL